MTQLTRRTILGHALAFLPSTYILTANARSDAVVKKTAEEVSPAEDLMREHGALNRMLLIYDHVAGELAAGQPTSMKALATTASLIQEFIENYHEQLPSWGFLGL